MDKKKTQVKSSHIIIVGIATILIIIPFLYPASFGEPSPDPSSSVNISYNILTETSIGWNYSSDYSGYVQSDPGNVFLVVNLTIKNNGYETFSTNPYYFDAVADGVRYGFDNRTFNVGNWDLIDMLNGETFSGTLIFQIPATTKSIAVDYMRENHEYTIIFHEVRADSLARWTYLLILILAIIIAATIGIFYWRRRKKKSN